MTDAEKHARIVDKFYATCMTVDLHSHGKTPEEMRDDVLKEFSKFFLSENTFEGELEISTANEIFALRLVYTLKGGSGTIFRTIYKFDWHTKVSVGPNSGPVPI